MKKAGTKYMLMLAAIVFIAGCSPKAGKKTLNFFFDGVPGEESENPVTMGDSLNLSDSLTAVSRVPVVPENIYHLPYLEKECSGCHDQNSMGEYVLPQPALCYQCHEDYAENYKVIHGPVAGGYCTECHHPHYSKEEYLLERTGQSLCLYCHVAGESFSMEVHDGIEDTNCTECHNPHGGEDRYMFN